MGRVKGKEGNWWGEKGMVNNARKSGKKSEEDKWAECQ